MCYLCNFIGKYRTKIARLGTFLVSLSASNKDKKKTMEKLIVNNYEELASYLGKKLGESE